MDGPKLVKMANDIAHFFRAEPDRKDAIAGVAGHLKKFWTRACGGRFSRCSTPVATACGTS